MKTVPLSIAAKIIMGQSPPSETYNKDGRGLPFFQGKADFGEMYPKRVFLKSFCG
jgi:type I restriction enzyme S subunit